MIDYFVSFLYWMAAFAVYIWVMLPSFFGDFLCLDYDALQIDYDYIIVGAGSAGSIVASRLAEDPNASVLLIEAGESCASWLLDIPIVSPLLQLSSQDWQFQTVEQRHSCYSLNSKSSRWPRGKVVGGTSHLNYMLYVRGHSQDFNDWFKDANPDWSFSEDILQYFKKSEKQKGRYKHDSFHFGMGPHVVSDLHHVTPLAEAFVKAGVELGYLARDVNSKYQTGFMESQVHMNEGRRWNVDYGYLAKQVRNNLRILCNAHVDKVLFQNAFEAYGVEGVWSKRNFSARAKRAVVLSAGSIGTPMILMRSGIGPSSHLNELKIPVRQDLPVGKNLQDHITTGMDLILLNHSLSLELGNIASIQSVWQYLLYGKGPWTTTGCEAFGIIHSPLTDPNTQPPDLQIMALPMGLSSDYGAHMRRAMGIKQEVWEKYFLPLSGMPVASLMPVLLHPRSHGEIKLQSLKVEDPPLIDPNYLSDEEDIKILYEGIKIVKEIIKTEAMAKLGARLYEESLPGCENEAFDTPEYWRCYIKHLTLTSYHPVGTCRMGPISDPSSVVDSHLRVHRTNNLFVIDASVMPSLPSGNINAAVMMIAEKGADLVKQFWYRNTRRSRIRNIFCDEVCDTF